MITNNSKETKIMADEFGNKYRVTIENITSNAVDDTGPNNMYTHRDQTPDDTGPNNQYDYWR